MALISEELKTEVISSFKRIHGFGDGYICCWCNYIEYASGEAGNAMPLLIKHVHGEEHKAARATNVPPTNKIAANIQVHDPGQQILFVNGHPKEIVFCWCCRKLLDGKLGNFRAHLRDKNHERKLGGDHRTLLQMRLDTEVSKHNVISLSMIL